MVNIFWKFSEWISLKQRGCKVFDGVLVWLHRLYGGFTTRGVYNTRLVNLSHSPIRGQILCYSNTGEAKPSHSLANTMELAEETRASLKIWHVDHVLRYTYSMHE